MMNKKVLQASWTCLALLPLAATAAPREVLSLSLEELSRLPVTAAAGFAQPRSEVPAAIHVVRAEQWEALGAHSVWQVLEHVPGLYVTETFGTRQLVAQGLLTTTNSQVLWLLDGLPLNELGHSGPLPAWDKGLAGLDRIEVIRGPLSVIHGSNAFSAVINLVSLPAGAGENRVAVRGGSFDTREAQVDTGGSTGDWRWRLSLEGRRSDGDRGRRLHRDQQSTFDALFGTQVSLAPGALPARDEVADVQLRLEWRDSSLQYWHWRNDASARLSGGAGALDPDSRIDSMIDHLALRQGGEFGALKTRWELEGLLQRHDVYLASTGLPPGTTLPVAADGNIDFVAGTPVIFPEGIIGISREEMDRRRLGLNLINQAWSGHTLRLSLGHEWQELREPESRRNFGPGILGNGQPVPLQPLPNLAGTALTFLPDVDRELAFVALQDDWHINEAWLLNLGVRHDHYSDFGASTNPRASLHWQATPATKLRFGYGTAFRAPSFNEQYLRNNRSILGNPALQPEELTSRELGLEQTLGAGLHLDATVFQYNARRLIDYAPQPPAVGLRAQNLAGRDGEGGTLELAWQPHPGTQLNANATLWRVEDSATGARVPFVPGVMAGVNGWWEFAPGWTLGGALKHVGDRRREAGDPRADLGDDTWADLHLHTTGLAPGLKLGLTVHNVADADLRDANRNTPGLGPTVPEDVPLTGRAVLLEASYTWGAPAREPAQPLQRLEGEPAPLDVLAGQR
jgi:iron complex outermembrane receptor protein